MNFGQIVSNPPIIMPAAIYWDTSALLKLYAPEQDSDQYRSLLENQTDDMAISFLHRVELNFALVAKEQRGEISKGGARQLFESFLKHREQGHFLEIPWGDDVERHAGIALETCSKKQQPVMLRTLDGLHLGAMLAAGINKIVTTDLRLHQAAITIGIDVI